MNLGAPEMVVVLLVVLVLFGGAKVPQLARSLGQAKHEFEKGARGDKSHTEPSSSDVVPMSADADTPVGEHIHESPEKGSGEQDAR